MIYPRYSGAQDRAAVWYAASRDVASTAATTSCISATALAGRKTGTFENKWVLGWMNVSQNSVSPASRSNASHSDARSSVMQKQD